METTHTADVHVKEPRLLKNIFLGCAIATLVTFPCFIAAMAFEMSDNMRFFFGALFATSFIGIFVMSSINQSILDRLNAIQERKHSEDVLQTAKQNSPHYEKQLAQHAHTVKIIRWFSIPLIIGIAAFMLAADILENIFFWIPAAACAVLWLTLTMISKHAKHVIEMHRSKHDESNAPLPGSIVTPSD